MDRIFPAAPAIRRSLHGEGAPIRRLCQNCRAFRRLDDKDCLGKCTRRCDQVVRGQQHCRIFEARDAGDLS